MSVQADINSAGPDASGFIDATDLLEKLGAIGVQYDASQEFALRLQAKMLIDDLLARLSDLQMSTRPLEGVDEAAVRWLATGERGLSSNTMFTHLTGLQAGSGEVHYPHDPSDLRRCLLLLEQVPSLREKFPSMAEVSPQWAALVKVWPELVALAEQEAPEWRARKGVAHQLFDKMQEVLKSA